MALPTEDVGLPKVDRLTADKPKGVKIARVMTVQTAPERLAMTCNRLVVKVAAVRRVQFQVGMALTAGE